jgi:shikimate kinase
MKNFSTIIIIGPLGVGKSTVGRELARQLNCEFYDTDREVESRLGVDLAWIFDVEGEAGFRRRESLVLDELSQKENVVLSTGGGTVLIENNRKIMKERGLVIYLYTDIKEQLKRTGHNKYNRPLLRVDNVEECLEKMNQERESLYQEIADVRFSTKNCPSKKIVELILDFLKKEKP